MLASVIPHLDFFEITKSGVLRTIAPGKWGEWKVMVHAEQLREKFIEILESKMDEFHLLGYDSVGVDEIWQCVLSKYKQELPREFQLVNDIYSLKPMQLMNWLQMKAFQGEIDIEKNSLL